MTAEPKRQYKIKNISWLDSPQLEKIALSKKELLFKRIVLLEFKKLEIKIYLQNYPDDKKAKEILKRYKIKQNILIKQYKTEFCPNFDNS